MSVTRGSLRAGLIARWRARFADASGVGDELVARYGDPGRVYHDLRHLAAVLHQVDRLSSEAADPRAVELAAWFHDAVYDIGGGGHDNEGESAALARRLLTPSVDAATVEEVARLVVLTRDHQVGAGDANGAVLCDADLAVLAAPQDEYDDYVARVRQEYAAVPEAQFRQGRAAVLSSLLALPRLYSTAYGADCWEAPARANLTRELTTLLP